MKKMLIIFITFFLVEVALAFTATEVYQQWEENFGSIRNFEIEYNIENIKQPLNVMPITRINHIYSDGKFLKESIGFRPKLEIDGEELPAVSIHYLKSFNGVDCVAYLPLRNRARIHEALKESSKEMVGYDEFLQDVFLISLNFNHHRLSFIRFEPPEELGLKMIRIGSEDVECIGFKSTSSSAEGSGKIEGWFAINKGMLLVKHNKSLDDKVINNIEVTELGSNINDPNFFYPKKVSIYHDYGKGDIIIRNYTVLKFKRNPIHSADAFNLSLPLGTYVSDRRIGETYKVGLKEN